MKYISVKEAAERWNISKRRVHQYCENGRILASLRVGRSWMIPATAEKPTDPRYVEPLVAAEEDEQWYYCYLDGDENGLRELMERYGDSLTRYVNSMIHDVQDAEDLMIEAFSRILVKKPKTFHHGFKAYLFHTARNLALRYLAKNRVHPHFSFEELTKEPEDSQCVEDTLEKRELAYILHQALQQLRPEYREALYLLYFEEMSYQEAAQIMKKTQKQMDNLVYRSKQALRPILEKEGITDAQYR